MPIYKEQNKKKWTKDGRCWYFKCYYTDIYGNRKQKVSKMYKLKSECQDAENNFLVEIKKNNIIESDPNFESIYNEWLDWKKRQIKSATYYSYKKCFDKNILSFFKNYKLHSIKINTINLWYNFLKQQNSTLKYQNSMIGHFQDLLKYARDNYNFDSKIISQIVKQRDETIPNIIREVEWNFWTYEEFQKFITVVDDSEFKLYCTFLYFTGLRFGEFAALNWNDINFENKTLNINKTLTNKLGKGTYDIFEPKTKNSIRVIDLDDNLIALLKEHCQKEKNIFNFQEKMFIFGNIKPISTSTFRRKLNKYIEISGVKRITIHGFRHSHVSLLYFLGCDNRDIAERIGDTIQIVESTYYHMYPSKKSNTVKVLNELKTRGNQEVNKNIYNKNVDIQRL